MAHLTPGFDQLVQDIIGKWKVPALSIAIVKGDDIYAKAYGFAKLPYEKCTEDTIFDLASTSKTTTAAAVACLVDDEDYPHVQWTTPVSKLLPDDFAFEDPEYTRNVTVEDILSHRTGLPTHDSSYFGVRSEHPDNAKSITRNIRNLPLNKPLRTTYQYSNIMFTAATHLVETISGEKYPDFLRKRLWKPLGMNKTFHDLPGIDNEPAKDLIATPYRRNDDGYVAIPMYPQPEGQGAGSIFCSPKQYARWIRALLKQSAPLSKSAHENLITPRTIIPADDDDEDLPFYSTSLYALGLVTETYRGHKVIGHGGGVPGFSTTISFMPEYDWGLVIFTNANSGFEAHQTLAHILMDDVIGVPEPDRIDWDKYWTDRHDKEKADREKHDDDNNDDDNDDEDDFFKISTHPEPLGVDLASLAGPYFNRGYKGFRLEIKDGKLVADCQDRCFPFIFTFTHLSGTKFRVDAYDVWDDITMKVKGRVRLNEESGKVEAVGVALEEDCRDLLIWFERV